MHGIVRFSCLFFLPKARINSAMTRTPFNALGEINYDFVIIFEKKRKQMKFELSCNTYLEVFTIRKTDVARKKKTNNRDEKHTAHPPIETQIKKKKNIAF